MANQLQLHGGQPSRPVRYGVIWTNRMFTGIFTQRSPLRDANSTRIEEAFYGSRGDALVDGLNVEVSPALTFIRRPGQSIYNSQTFPPINRFYENRTSVYNASQTQASEKIQVIADTASVIYDATGPSTKTAIFNKTAGAGKTSFLAVGNTLYFSDGPDQKKYITPSKIWAPNQTFNTGDQVLDSNGNLQVVQGTGTASIAQIAVVRSKLGLPLGPFHYFLAITFTSNVYWTAGTNVSFSGITNYTALNGQTLPVVTNNTFLPPAANLAYFPAVTPTLYGPAPDTGTATSTSGTGGGQSGAAPPAWNVALGGLTTDNQLVWQNFGFPLYNWGLATPAAAPATFPITNNRQWNPNTALALNYAIMDLTGNVQVVYIAGTTGSTTPTWGSNIPFLGSGFAFGGTPETITIFGSGTQDGSVSWRNCGPPGVWNASTNIPLTSVILDSNGNWQLCSSAGSAAYGTTGASVPVWNTTIGGATADNTITWVCLGPGSVIISGSVQYAYSYHSIDGSLSTASPLALQNISSAVVGPANNQRLTLAGNFLADPQVDAVWIWRTVQGGSTLLFDSAISNPNPGTASSWIFSDVIPDTALNALIEAPIADTNNPPPMGLTGLSYHLGRIWGFVGNALQYSDGPDVISGNGNTAWSPSNIFIYPSTGIRGFPTTYGLIVFTTAGNYVVQGQGTTSSSFFSTPYLDGIGIQSYDGFTVNGSMVFIYTSDNQILSLDPNGGVTEVGFPIGDQFGPLNGTQTFTPTSTMLTWHVAGSQDKGLYVSDQQGTWWRLCPTPAPESGLTWSPKAQIVGGFSAVQSVETTPGTHQLLIGPKTSGPILARDYTVYSDNGSAYDAWFILGSIVLAQPGQIAMVESFTLDSWARGAPPTLAVQLDEIAPVTSGLFEPLTQYVPDPTQLEPPTSLYAQRFYLSQTQDPAWCRHLQIQVNWGTDTVKNELLSMSVFGGWDQEK